MRKLLIATALVVLVAIVAGPATAGGKGSGGRASGRFSLVLLDGASEPRHGGRITFNVTASVNRPFVGLRCWQGADFVYDGYVGYFPTYAFDPWFTLGSPYWTDGVVADCTARLFYFNRRGGENVLAKLGFQVNP